VWDTASRLSFTNLNQNASRRSLALAYDQMQQRLFDQVRRVCEAP
jgi:hypothetical protein